MITAATSGEHHPLAPFHQLEIGGDADVTIVQGGIEAIDIAAPRRATVDANVSDGRLVVRSRDGRRWWQRLLNRESASKSAAITVHLRSLDTLVLSGSVNVNAPRLQADALRVTASGGTHLTIDALDATSLRVDGSGALDANLAGRVTEQHVSISGAGTYRAERLIATDATVSVSGVGNVVVHAERNLRASISGAGLIEYLGDPKVIEQVSGIGRVRRREPSAPTVHVADSHCNGEADGVSASLNSSGPPVTGSRSACTPPLIRTSATRQSRIRPTSALDTSATVSYG